jgi:hypothetical protein
VATESLKLARAWDDDFRGWTESLQLGRKFKKPARSTCKPSTWTGSPVGAREPEDYPGKGSKADVRARLRAIVRQGRQVMVKITPGKNQTMRSVRKHLHYIGQDGQGVVYDQDGHAHRGEDEVNDLAWKWQHVGPTMPEEANTRLAFNIMFSMPEGTDERALFAAVQATAAIEFAGHQWAMGQHFDRPHVHCHISVKAEGMDGVRLNPRKADLQRWRERFAHELRKRGVEAEATRRASRMHQQRMNKPWAVTRLETRGLSTNPAPAQADRKRVHRWRDTEMQAASSYERIIDALQRSSDVADRVLARELAESLVGRQARTTVRYDNRIRPDLDRS